jgi:hypothetical protein
MITNLLIKGLNDLMPVLEGVIKFLGDLFTAIDTGDWSTVWATITSIVETAWGNFKSWFETNWNVFWTQTVPAAWTAFKQLFEAGWTTFWNITAPAAWTTFKQLLELGWNTFWNVTIPAAWESFKMLFQIAWDTFWNGIRTVAEGIWNGIKTAWDNFWGGLRDGVQSALDWLQGKSGTATAGANAISGGVMGKPSTGTALPGMGGIPRMAAGGIVGSPMLAMVGDAPRRKGGEVIAPLTDLMGMIQQAIGGGGPTINIYGPFGPGYTPAQAGAQAAAGYANQMRARGAKI